MNAEPLVLCREAAALRRQSHRPTLDWADSPVLAALAQLLAGPIRMGLLMTPDTLLCWHRRLARWRWTYPHRGGQLPANPGSRC